MTTEDRPAPKVAFPETDHAALGPPVDAKLAQAECAARPLKHASRLHAVVSQLLAASGRRAEAIERLLSALALPPGSAQDCEALGFVAFGLGQHQVARELYARVTDMLPRDATAWYNLATGERSMGDLKAAEAASSKAITLDPQLFQLYLFRSQLFVQTASTNHVTEVREALRVNRNAAAAQIFLNYALGKELDDLGRYDEAYAHFALGARSRRDGMRYDLDRDLAKLSRIAEVFDNQTLQRTAAIGGSERFAFIVGLPRSGTTLIERLLTGHPRVRSNGETDTFSTALLRNLPASADDVFWRAAQADLDKVASAYANAVGHSADPRLVLEKLPLNYLYAGSIHMALPRSKIILVRRGAVDNCFAMFSTLFGTAYPFSYDFGELAAYYAAYDALVSHWKSCLSDQLLEVSYEDFVRDPAGIGPVVASHLVLDWRPEMLKIENNATSSATESAAQIRRPIYRSAVGRWRNYSDHLKPLIHALASQGVPIEP